MEKFNFENYQYLVAFLGKFFGKNVEVVLHDLSDYDCSIIAIENGHISGRDIGAPLTNFALVKLRTQHYKYQRYFLNYEGVSNNKKLRSASLFIYDDKDQPVGMLCVNMDTTEYAATAKVLMALCEIDTSNHEVEPIKEYFPHSVSDIVKDAYESAREYSLIEPERLTVDEKTEIIRRMNVDGIFQIKGTIGEVAKLLKVSEATIYRYLGKVRK